MEHQLDYKFSDVVDPSTYETHGLCDGIPLRCHHNPEYEEIETLRCQEDWRRWVGPLGFYKGGLGPRWNSAAVYVTKFLSFTLTREPGWKSSSVYLLAPLEPCLGVCE